MSLRADDLLPVGTEVRVKNRIGTILKAEMIRAVPSGMIALHTVRFTKRIICGFASTEIDVVDLRPITHTVHYSFIVPVQKEIA